MLYFSHRKVSKRSINSHISLQGSNVSLLSSICEPSRLHDEPPWLHEEPSWLHCQPPQPLAFHFTADPSLTVMRIRSRFFTVIRMRHPKKLSESMRIRIRNTAFLPVMKEGFVADVTPADAHLGDIAIKLLIKDPASKNLLYFNQF